MWVKARSVKFRCACFMLHTIFKFYFILFCNCVFNFSPISRFFQYSLFKMKLSVKSRHIWLVLAACADVVAPAIRAEIEHSKLTTFRLTISPIRFGGSEDGHQGRMHACTKHVHVHAFEQMHTGVPSCTRSWALHQRQPTAYEYTYEYEYADVYTMIGCIAVVIPLYILLLCCTAAVVISYLLCWLVIPLYAIHPVYCCS